MNSTKKGLEFENIVFEKIERLINDGTLGLIPENCRLFKRKGYFSRDRGSEIITDISLELWESEANNWTMLWVFECKNYETVIPVNELEEFKAKIDQIAGLNVKAIFASSCAYQKGALAYAKANVIGLLRIMSDRQVLRVLYQRDFGTPAEEKERKNREVQTALLEQSFISDWNSVYCTLNNSFYDDFNGFMEELLNQV